MPGKWGRPSANLTYARCMRPRFSELTKAINPVSSFPADDEYPPPLMWPGASLQGLIDDASNFGVAAAADWARMRGAFMTPTAIGTDRAAIPVTVSAIFFAKVSLSTMRFVMIASILFLRLDPVTPDTHTSGDSA